MLAGIRQAGYGPILVAAAGLLVGLAGCAESVPRPQVVGSVSDATQVLPGQWRIAGWSVQNRPIMVKEFGSGGQVVMILAGIHGDETAGIALVEELARYLDSHLDRAEGRRILIVPKANPDGLAGRTRQNVRGVDLNRNFPTDNRTASPEAGDHALSEPETWAIWQLVWQCRPDRIISVHQPLGCVDFDGPGEGLAKAMASRCGLPVRKLGARPGSLGSYGEQIRGIPIVTLELPDRDIGLDGARLWSIYGQALLEAIRWPGVPLASRMQ